MSIVPSGLFQKYNEFTQHFLDDFGADCVLHYTEKISVISNELPDVYQRKSMEMLPTDTGFSRGDINYKTVEQTEEIRMRVYWRNREYKEVGKITYKDGDLVGYGLIEDLYKVERAYKMVIHPDLTPDHTEWVFEKSNESILHGLTNKEFISFWKRING